MAAIIFDWRTLAIWGSCWTHLYGKDHFSVWPNAKVGGTSLKTWIILNREHWSFWMVGGHSVMTLVPWKVWWLQCYRINPLERLVDTVLWHWPFGKVGGYSVMALVLGRVDWWMTTTHFRRLGWCWLAVSGRMITLSPYVLIVYAFTFLFGFSVLQHQSGSQRCPFQGQSPLWWTS